MPTVAETVRRIVSADTWDQRVAQIRLVEQNHGTGQHAEIFAQVAREAYVPHLAPDFAYIHEAPFYDRPYFSQVYDAAAAATRDFQSVDEADLARTLATDPRTLLIFRTTLGLTHQEFAHCTALVAGSGFMPVSASKVKAMEQKGAAVTTAQANVLAATLTKVMDGSLFGDPGVPELQVKQQKLDTEHGWQSVQEAARNGVQYSDFLHQRHYGGAFRQVLDATSTKRGNLLEDAVEQLFQEHAIPYLRTGAHNQGDIEARFELRVHPAPDFVVFDASGTLRGMLECKLVNDGGTARDKALRFERLRQESIRLGGVPLLAALAGLGWARVNDTLGPVVRDTEGRVFTLATLPEMLHVSPFPARAGVANVGLHETDH